MGNTSGELPKSTTISKVYDILNCGERHRFVVNGCLVHNCGYGGGVPALKRTGADELGLSDTELEEIKQSWRKASPRIVQLWSDVNNAALEAVREQSAVSLQHGVRLEYRSGMLFIRLPSGRCLAYVKPRVEYEEDFGREGLTYYGKAKDSGGWGKQRTYGGKLVENIVQAIARDCLAVAMTRLEASGYPVVMHIHDEVVIETPREKDCLADVCETMSWPIEWAPGLKLTTDGYVTDYYKKD